MAPDRPSALVDESVMRTAQRDEIVEIGYSTARAAIDEWLKNADMPRKPTRERAVL